MSELFQDLNLSNKVHRNGYDLSRHVNMTAKAGELLPVAHFDCIVGDRHRIQIAHKTRTAPVDTAAYTRIREYFDVFSVPYRILWKNAPQVHTKNQQNPVSASSPYSNLPVGILTPQFDFTLYHGNSGTQSDSILRGLCQMQNSFGYNRGAMSAKLMNHLGYSYFSIANLLYYCGQKDQDRYLYFGQNNLSLYPLLAYQCIYYNFFRNTQWEDNQPYNYNVDYLSANALVPFKSPVSATSDPGWSRYWLSPTVFDLQYANYPKDFFFGLLPDSQFGDPAEVDATTDYGNAYSMVVGENSDEGLVARSSNGSTEILERNDDGTQAPYSGALFTLDDITTSFTILNLRKAQFLQKYREIRGSGNNDYRTIIKKVFNVDLPDDLAGLPEYLGGYHSDINISEIENTNLIGDNPALLKGKGVGSSNSRVFEFECKEPSLIMIIYHAQPIMDFALNALHFDVVRTEADDFADPMFDQLGFQEVPSYFLDSSLAGINGQGLKQSFLGYSTRYFDYKTGIDMTLGDFRETSKSWLAPLNFDYLKNYINGQTIQLNANFFRINPSILDPIFSVKAGWEDLSTYKNTDPQNFVSTDQLRIVANISINSVRPLDRDGVPY